MSDDKLADKTIVSHINPFAVNIVALVSKHARIVLHDLLDVKNELIERNATMKQESSRKMIA